MMATTNSENRNFIALNISESMFRETAVANQSYALEIMPVTWDMLRGKNLVSIITQPAIIERVNNMYGIDISNCSEKGIHRIKLQLGDTLYTVATVDGPALKVSTKNGELLPPGTRLQLTRYRFVPKQ